MNINKILLPFDNSDHSVNAAHYALDLAKLYHAHVSIVYCFEEWNAYDTELEVPANLTAKIKADRKKAAKEILKKAEGIFEKQGVEYSLEVIVGSPGSALVERLKSQKYDMIIMGSHGHSDIAGLFLGSVTHKVLNTIYCPVLVVP